MSDPRQRARRYDVISRRLLTHVISDVTVTWTSDVMTLMLMILVMMRGAGVDAEEVLNGERKSCSDSVDNTGV